MERVPRLGLSLTQTLCTLIRISFPRRTAKLKQFADLLEALASSTPSSPEKRDYQGYPQEIQGSDQAENLAESPPKVAYNEG
jgi:hypothetical protein